MHIMSQEMQTFDRAVPDDARDLTTGLWLGLLGVAIFALTLPVTRLAVGTAEAPQLSGVFIATARAAIAAVLSLFFLAFTHAPKPARSDWPSLLAVTAGVVFAFPLFSSIALRHVEAVHASVMTGILPLATAVVGAWLARQRPSLGFWACAALGSALVIAFALLKNDLPGLRLQSADVLMLLACVGAAFGYAHGGRLATRMRAEHVICWALVLGLPFSLPAALWSWPTQPVAPSAWAGLAYVTLFSQWLGFFAWYRALALGGTVRVSQVQLMQPFLAMGFAVPLLGESIDAVTWGFGLAVIATVFIGRRMAVGAPAQTVSVKTGVGR